MGEKRLVGNASRKESWIISACFSTLGDECLGDCQGWQSNRAGLIANAKERCKPLAFISTTKQAFPNRKEGRKNLRGHGKQVVTSRGTGRVGEYWSLEATLEAVQVVCKRKQFAIFTCPRLLHSTCSRSSFVWAASRQVVLKQLWSRVASKCAPSPTREK